MPRPKTFRDIVKILKKHDPRFDVVQRRGKGSHRMICHPDIDGRKEAFPLVCHGEGTTIYTGYLSGIIRTFKLPSDIFD